MKVTFKKIKLFFIAAFIATNVTAQKEKNFILGVNPFAPLGLTNVPRIEIFAEKFFKNSSIALDLGAGNFAGNYDSTILKKIGFRTALTYKNYRLPKFLTIKRPNEKLYYGLNLFYWKQQGTGYFTGMKADSLTELTDAYGVRRTAYGGNIIFGYQAILAQRISFDIYFGLGYKVLEIENTNREYNADLGDYSTHVDCGIYPCIQTLSEDSYKRMNVACGFRMGYLFYRNKSQKGQNKSIH